MKKIISKIGLLSLALAIVLTGTSCSMDQNIHFNEDLSGTYSMSFDMGGMMDMMKSMGEGEEGEEGEGGEEGEEAKEDPLKELGMLDSTMSESLKGIEGITNIKSLASKEEGSFGIAYDFSGLTALNQAMVTKDEEASERLDGPSSFSAGKKSLDFNAAALNQTFGKELGNEEMAKSLEQMGSMFTMNLTYSFDKEIKKLKGQNVELVNSRTIKFVNFMEGMKKGGSYNDFSVKFK